MGRFIGLLLVFILVVPLIRMVVGMLARAFTNFAGAGKSETGPARVPAGGKLIKDPICGTFVSETVAKTLTSGGKTHHFCSDECLKKFLEKSRRT
jgi:YHS domain-containing protein